VIGARVEEWLLAGTPTAAGGYHLENLNIMIVQKNIRLAK
jgi:hypothetical protein